MYNVVYNTDVLNFLSSEQDDQYNLIISDPPYLVGKDFGNDSDSVDYDYYRLFSELWIRESLRVLHPHGTLLIYGLTPINWFMWGILRSYCNNPTKQLKELVWYYTNKQVPRMSFYRPSHENIIVYFKNENTHTFNEDLVREPYETDYAKFAGKKRPKGNSRFGDSDSIYNVNPLGALPRDVIKVGTLAGGNGKERIIGDGSLKHPTQKPEKLTEKLILGSSNEGDLVFIPFAGSGTECFISHKLSRYFIGCEINEGYVRLIQQRFESGGFESHYANQILKIGGD